MIGDTVAGDSPGDVPDEWREFPNAIRRTAWEVLQRGDLPLSHEQTMDMFKRLIEVMRGNDTQSAATRSRQLKEFLSRARPLMTACLEATSRYGWIDFPLTGNEPYMDGTFPEPEREDPEIDESGMKMENTVARSAEREADTVVKKEIKEEPMEEGEMPPVIEPLLFTPPPTLRRQVKKKEEEEELSTRDYGRYLEAAAARTISGTNFTVAEKGGIKQAIKDMVFKGVSMREAAVKYGVAPQRLVAFATKTKQECRRLKEEEIEGAGPSTSNSSLHFAVLPPPSASEQEKLNYMNKQLDSIVGSSTLNPSGRQLLKRAVKLVVWDGLSIAAASARVGIPASTMFPYVAKARSQLCGFVRAAPSLSKKSLGPNDAEERKEEDKATVDEITLVVNEVLGVSEVDQRVYEILVEVLAGAISPLQACTKRKVYIASVAPYLATARARLGSRLPPQKKDPASKVAKIEETHPHEKGIAVLNGYRLPQSMNEICMMISRGELSHVEARPFEGTREELKKKIQGIVARFRYQQHHARIADAVMATLVDHETCYEASDKFDLSPTTIGGYAKVMRMLIDMNDFTIVEEDGTRRVIPPREKYERGKKGSWRKRKAEERSNGEGKEEEEEEGEEDGESEESP